MVKDDLIFNMLVLNNLITMLVPMVEVISKQVASAEKENIVLKDVVISVKRRLLDVLEI